MWKGSGSLAAGVVALGLLVAGCAEVGHGPNFLDNPHACAPVPDGVAVCVNDKPVEWKAKTKPHMHEAGGFYAPLEELAAALGAKAELSADKQSVSVGGKAVVATAKDARGVHQHDGLVFAPIKEFAEAAGYKVQVDAEKKVVTISK